MGSSLFTVAASAEHHREQRGSNKSTGRVLQPINEVPQMCVCRLIFTLTSNYAASVAEADLKQLQPRLDKTSLFIVLLLVE